MNSRQFFIRDQVRTKPTAVRVKLCNSLAYVFPRFAPPTFICFGFWLVHWIVCVICEWPVWLFWFWFYNIESETALYMYRCFAFICAVCNFTWLCVFLYLEGGHPNAVLVMLWSDGKCAHDPTASDQHDLPWFNIDVVEIIRLYSY